jgi:co-chaperonin GroES (HSP10)
MSVNRSYIALGNTFIAKIKRVKSTEIILTEAQQTELAMENKEALMEIVSIGSGISNTSPVNIGDTVLAKSNSAVTLLHEDDDFIFVSVPDYVLIAIIKD